MEVAYLISVEDLIGDGELDRRACRVLDEIRKKRIERFKVKDARAECIGAGLLIMLFGLIAGEELQKNEEELICLTAGELLALVETRQRAGAVCRQVQTDPNGKPYFAGKPVCFNISHSAGYVFGVVSDEEVGVDIQQCEGYKDHGIEERFYHEKENELFDGLSEEERAELFFFLWVEKESYGKLLGSGISETISVDTQALEDKVRWKQYEGPAGYVLMSCKSLQNDKEQKTCINMQF